jgi:hypothetical protein
MPMIRHDLHTFTLQWNGHKINKRKGREHVHYGTPKILYRLPDPTKAVHCGVPVHEPTLNKLVIEAERDAVDAERYLPEEIMELCQNLLMGKDFWKDEDREKAPGFLTYNYLRVELERHRRSELQPQLRLCERPTGAYRAFRERMAEFGVDESCMEHIDVATVETPELD